MFGTYQNTEVYSRHQDQYNNTRILHTDTKIIHFVFNFQYHDIKSIQKINIVLVYTKLSYQHGMKCQSFLLCFKGLVAPCIATIL